MIYQGLNVVGLIPTLGMYAAIAFRIMPSVSRILYSAQQAKYNRPSVEIVSNEISLVKDTKNKYPFKKLVGPVFNLSVNGLENAFKALDSKKSIRPAIVPK